MKCKDCKACDHEMCTIHIFPSLLKKSKEVGCSLNHIQVDYHIRELAPTNREWINSLSDTLFIEYFADHCVCEYIQDYDDEWCKERPRCNGCIETWLKQKHLENS